MAASRPPTARIVPLYSQVMHSTSPSLASGIVSSLFLNTKRRRVLDLLQQLRCVQVPNENALHSRRYENGIRRVEENGLYNVVMTNKHLLPNIVIVLILATEVDTMCTVHVGKSTCSFKEETDHFVPSGDQARGELA